MSRRHASLQNEPNAQFVSADALLARALEEEARKVDEVELIDSSHTVMERYSRIREEIRRALDILAQATDKDEALEVFRQKYKITMAAYKGNKEVSVNLPKWLNSMLYKIDGLDVETQIKVRKIVKRYAKQRGPRVNFDSFSTNNDMKRALNEMSSIGGELELHKCSYTVDLDGTVRCKDCGKGSSSTKKASHKNSRKHAKPTKSF
tara:strand:- start:16636 stop:17253 length:618 start_codon:yes stop_codon:yes gene_type:complete